MKMSKESFNIIQQTFISNKEIALEGSVFAESKLNAKDGEIMAGWKLIRTFAPKGFITDVLYGKEGLNDKHINTAIKKAFKELKTNVSYL